MNAGNFEYLEFIIHFTFLYLYIILPNHPCIDFQFFRVSLKRDNIINNIFLDPYLFPDEQTILYKYLNKSKVLFQFRTGGITHQAAKRGLKIYCVEIGLSWIHLLKNEIQNINHFLGKTVDITYLLSDLNISNPSFTEFKNYVKIYNHKQYNADLIYIDGEYQFSCLMNLYNQIDENVVIIVHELIETKFLKIIIKYYHIVEHAYRSYVFRKKNQSILLSNSSIEEYQNKDFSIENSKTQFFKFMNSNYNDIVTKYNYYYNDDMIKPLKKQIWFFWWQKIKEAPTVVKLCLSAVKKNFDGEINVITQENYLNYTTIPSYVIEKMRRKNISLTHFADVYRMKLLSERGGLWIDATLLSTQIIPSDIFNYPYFTIRFNDNFKYILGKWCTFIQGSYINNIVTKFCSEILLAHMKKYDTFPFYFYLDYIILFGYDNLPQFRRDIQLIPINNQGVLKLMSYILDIYTDQNILPFENNTVFIKMSWKRNYKSTIDNNMTIYGYFEKKYFDI